MIAFSIFETDDDRGYFMVMIRIHKKANISAQALAEIIGISSMDK